MTTRLTDEEIKEALETCAAEPVHTPGTVQPFACLLGINIPTGKIGYASENCADILGKSPSQLLGASLRDNLNVDLWHHVMNVRATGELTERAVPIGRHEVFGSLFEVRAFENESTIIIEIEREVATDLGGGESLASLSLLMMRIQSCTEKATLLDQTVDLLRHLTSYDRVSLHRFDNEGSGEILAESKRTTLDSWKGLSFPSQDIPPQAREVMRRLSFRFIQDVDQTPVPIVAARKNAKPLDISLAASRGISEIHMQYLRNMGVAATLTLSLVVDNKLWGLITFHAHKPKIPTPAIREILSNFLPLFVTKLQSLEQAEHLRMIERINDLNDAVTSKFNQITDLDQALPIIAPMVMETLSATGVVISYGSQLNSSGVVPSQDMIEELKSHLAGQDLDVLAIDDLRERYPDRKESLNGCCGALLAKIDEDRILLTFRPETVKNINWAGNPEKNVEMVGSNLRIQPRGSFSTYLQQVSGRSRRWTGQDIYFAKRFLPVISAAERKVLMVGLQRQQNLMITELNHRVRNILALVRSVSRQASRSFGSLQSYSKALETRIQALATAHDLTSHSFDLAVSIRGIIRQELEPHAGIDFSKVNMLGPDGFVRPETAPVFSLVIHELVTNSAKYGSLSVAEGTLDVELEETDLGLLIKWKEHGGPEVVKPNHRGFGSALIEQAVAFELDGTSKLDFHPSGVRAEIFLPYAKLEPVPRKQGQNPTAIKIENEVAPFRAEKIAGVVLFVEDNYVIALDTEELLGEMGFYAVETVSNVEDALEFLTSQTPVFALLDLSLGRNQTCEPIAVRLREMNVPIILSTGYGESSMISKNLSDIPRVQKPLALTDLERELHRIFSD